MPTKRKSKRSATKRRLKTALWSKTPWRVYYGELARGRGRPDRVPRLLSAVAEKIPFEAIDAVEGDVENRRLSKNGVYVAHDSMGYARYVGRGKNVFKRLDAHWKAHPLELQYFSFYIVENNQHEREIETLLIRAGGPHLHFNERKRRIDTEPGNVRDFEPGTAFYERQKQRGRRRQKKRGPKPKNLSRAQKLTQIF